jgi:hypothetical protein
MCQFDKGMPALWPREAAQGFLKVVRIISPAELAQAVRALEEEPEP